MSKRKEYISETVKAILKNKSLNEFRNIGASIKNFPTAVIGGWEHGAGTPSAADIANKIFYLDRNLRRTPPGPERKDIEDQIRMLRSIRGRFNIGRRAGGIARKSYVGGLSTTQSAISGTITRGAELALGKGTKSVGLEGLGIASPVDAPDLSRINR